MASRTIFCPNCQVEVESISSAGPGGIKVPRCSICGMVIEESTFEDNDKSLSLDEVSFVDESISIPSLDRVMVVGYNPSLRQLLVDKLADRHVAASPGSVASGEDMIQSVIKMFESGKNGLDLIITDVPMPYLNGINAAIGLRAIEKNYPDHDLVPILFLTNKACDDTFKKVIRYLSPAKYATLGPVEDKAALSAHLNKIFALVSKENW